MHKRWLKEEWLRLSMLFGTTLQTNRDYNKCVACNSYNTRWELYEENNDILRCYDCGLAITEDELRRGILS